MDKAVSNTGFMDISGLGVGNVKSQIAWENKMINNQNYSAISEQLREIGRMIGGWQRQLGKK